LLDAWAQLNLLGSKTLEEMSAHPVLLCPMASITAFRHDEPTWNNEGRAVEYVDAVRHTRWFNAVAARATVVPAGHSPERLPMG
jgi:Asp-tRNA(Asn)/Glu-tRNA(Gln) amidotransferase A subunit family amidase